MAERLRLSGKFVQFFSRLRLENQRRSLKIRSGFSVRQSLTAMCGGKAAFKFIGLENSFR